MAVFRPTPTCQFCGKPIATGIFEDRSNIPSFLRVFGDTFIRWDFKECNCKEAKKFRKERKKQSKSLGKLLLKEIETKTNKKKENE